MSRRHQITTLALNLGLFAGLSALPLQAQDDENIPAGYTEDEWFDPGDWFDGNNIEPARTDWWDNDGWSNSTGYGYNRSDNDGWSNSADNERNSDQSALDKYRTTGTRAGRNQRQNRPDQQAKRNHQPDMGDRNQKSHGNRDHSMRTVSFDGKVDGFKKVNLKNRQGTSNEQTFVRIRLQNDETQVVSLGSRVNVSDLGLEKGDRIEVSGRHTRIDNREVLVAGRIKVGDKLFRIRKHNRPEIGQHVSIHGTVKESSKTSLSGDSREKNLLIRLEFKNGKSCVVDLGRDTTLSDLDIEEGSEIRLQGEKTKVEGKSLIIANMISSDGEKTRLREQSRTNEGHRRDSGESPRNPIETPAPVLSNP